MAVVVLLVSHSLPQLLRVKDHLQRVEVTPTLGAK